MKATYKISLVTAISVVIANMIGTGVFTSIGFQVIDLHTTFAILLLWVLGGIMALCGALTYGEIGAAFPNSGGEYIYLSKLYHPLVGFLSGWVSSTVGFAAPVALAAMALGKYVQSVFPSVNETILAITVVCILTLIHSYNLRFGAAFQRVATVIKVVFIVLFITAGFIYTPQHSISILPTERSSIDIFSGAFAVSLYWVSYSYSGWNAAAYMTGDIKDPSKNLPKSLLIGTSIVTIFYLLLNYIFLYTAPVNELAGQVEIGHISAQHIFGQQIGNVIGIVIALLLVSSISAMILAGPRVASSIGKNITPLKVFATENKQGVPYVSIMTQSLIAIILIASAKFDDVLKLIGFVLTVFTFLTVLGVFVLRTKFKHIEKPYKTWGYPVTPILFLIINAWILCFGFYIEPKMSLYGLGLIALGVVVWFILKQLSPVSPLDENSIIESEIK
jgi:APA family basic amino acid/polyamine antiporter